jgi:D-beta-D-heptose 7-phosphate kinase/D-beta-D-heptose 1-phosphate adenosyltransferase
VEHLGAPIVSLDEFAALRPTLGTVVATSGGFDPIHPGHISCIIESAGYGDSLVVIVNGDSFLTEKKGKPFQDCRTRCLIVSGIRAVDYVVPFDAPGDQTVSRALEAIRPAVFTKGGDRVDASTIPEWSVCQEIGAEIVTGVGMTKEWSSSWFLENWRKQ